MKFYDFYFGNIARDLNLDIKDFLDPLNFKTSQKTLSYSFLKRLFSSAVFKTDFLDYLTSGRLKQDYRASVPTKITKVLGRFDKVEYSNNPGKMTATVHLVQTYFRTNRQCKLPWTHNEVDNAVDCLIHSVQNVK